MEIKKTFKNLLFTFISNVVSTLISIVTVTILPKILTMKGYGYYQLFVFYAGYVGIMHFGWNDGLYLNNGGKFYDKLNKPQLFNQFWMQALMLSVFASIGAILSNYFVINIEKQYILYFVMIYMLISNLRVMLLYLLQVTNRLKEYAITNVIGRITFIIIALLLTIVSPLFWIVILADLIGRIVSLCFGIYYCKDIVFYTGEREKVDFKEIKRNIADGSKLMISNLSAQLILGVIKFGIERNWSIEIFAKISLAITASNMLMMFMNAIGLVLYPEICRTEHKKLSLNYSTFQEILGFFSVLILFLYYPAKIFLNLWLPEYSDSLIYMAIIFPATIFEAKMSVLTGNTLKRFRKEKILLIGNLVTLVFACIFTFVFSHIFNNLYMLVLLIPIFLAFRSCILDVYLFVVYQFGDIKEFICEILIVFIFILSNLFLTEIYAEIIVFLTIAAYFLTRLKSVKNIRKIVSNILTKDILKIK